MMVIYAHNGLVTAECRKKDVQYKRKEHVKGKENVKHCPVNVQ